MRGSSDEDVDRMKTRVFNHDSWGPLNNLVIKMVVPGAMLVVVESMILKANGPPPLTTTPGGGGDDGRSQ